MPVEQASHVDISDPGRDAAQPSQTAAANPFLGGNPATVGVPLFIVGSVALGLALVGYVPTTGAALSIILFATAIGQFITCLWAVALGESVVASIFGLFGGFWFSYGMFVIGLGHHWYGVATSSEVHASALFLISWLVVIALLTLATFRLPLIFTAIFVLVEVALVLDLAGTLGPSTGEVKAAGVVVFAFALLGAIVYIDAMLQAQGAKGVPLGRPVLRT